MEGKGPGNHGNPVHRTQEQELGGLCLLGCTHRVSGCTGEASVPSAKQGASPFVFLVQLPL